MTNQTANTALTPTTPGLKRNEGSMRSTRASDTPIGE